MSSEVIIDDIIPRTQLTASASQTVFNTNWTADVATDILVYARAAGVEPDDITQLVDPSLYDVTFIGLSSNIVRVTFLSGRTVGDIITIVRDTPSTRLNLYINTNFTPSMLNEDFGVLTLVDQQAQMYDYIINPGYNVSATIGAQDKVLPILGAFQVWRMNSTATAIEAVEIADNVIPAPAEAFYWLSEPNAQLGNGVDMGALASGLLKQTVTLGHATPAIAIEGTDYWAPGDALTRTQAPTVGSDVVNKTYADAIAGGAVNSVVGTANQININSTDPHNPVASISNTLSTPGTFTVEGTTAINAIINDSSLATASATNVSTALAMKTYIDAIAIGLNVQGSCEVATTTALTVTYANGTAGVGATLTNATTQAILTLDGISPAVGQRVLVKNQASTFQNGIYTVTNAGSVSTNWVLTRATDFDTAPEIQPGDLVVIVQGTTQAQSSWMQTNTVTTVGTDAIVFIQFSASIPVSMANGGSSASLTPSVGGIIYSTAGAMAVLAGTITARQMLQSGASGPPAWSTATWPATTTINQILYSSAANVVAAIASANGGVMITNSTGVPSMLANPTATGRWLSSVSGDISAWSTATLPVTATSTGTILRADGTNWVATSTTYPNTTTVSQFLYASANNVIAGLASANSAMIVTNSTGVPALTASMTNGQIVIGSTAGTPAPATITAGTGITITNAANSITIAANAAGEGGFKSRQIFTTGSAATYTKPAGITSILVQIWGGGGGGGGSAGSGTGLGLGGGGGAGGYAELYVASAASTYTYTVGAAGTAGTAGANAGGPGGTTTFSASSLQATGGSGGSGGVATTTNNNALAVSGGIGTNGDVNGTGTYGASSTVVNGLNGTGTVGPGGPTVLSGGTTTIGVNNGTAGKLGAGGSGGISTTSNQSGGAGGTGVIIVWEYS